MKNTLFDLEDKVAIVTGASRGLGRAIACGLAEAGADIVASDVLDTTDTVHEIKERGRKALGLKVDVSNTSDVDTMVSRTIKDFDQVDILVNNAGILKTNNAEDFDQKDWDNVLQVNLTGQFLCAQAVGKQMIKQKSGKIINISSIAGLAGYATSAPYSASKAGVISLTKTLAAEWGKHNIKVNSICPGVFATDMTEEYLKSEEFKNRINRNVPLERYAEPEELIGTVIFLASAASEYVTGHSVVVDGGWTAAV